MMKILIDNGHGASTPGKRSPDSRLLEYEWTRSVARRLTSLLTSAGIDSRLLVPETEDVSLRRRVERANSICRREGVRSVALISLHVNAAGDGLQWHSARGWSGWVAPKASEQSRCLARLLFDEASGRHLLGNRAVPSQHYWEGNFAMVRDTVCPAVLTENLFMDNHDDCLFLLSDAGMDAIARLHAAAIEKFIGERS